MGSGGGNKTTITQAWIGNTMFTGGFKGEIIAWNGKSAGAQTKAHEGKCTALYASVSGANTLISGGADGKIICWQVNGSNLSRVKELNLKAPGIQSMRPEVVSVCDNKFG